jgi:aryl-alcohol dehydrogenase-like predicted oxidoreductase
VPFDDSVGALVELQREGKVRHIGLSNVTVDELARARALTPIVSVQNRFNAADRSSDHVLDACERDGIAFIPWAPVGGHRPGHGDGLDDVAARHGATAVQVALAWLLARSPVMVPIPGTSTVAHLDENIAAASIELTENDRALLS